MGIHMLLSCLSVSSFCTLSSSQEEEFGLHSVSLCGKVKCTLFKDDRRIDA